ncbi:hypothetical protein [Peribacillus loiseleuriae]|uniref:PIN domain-containing protein n=1 Tax=Peribacillus loiseleuriae TaxID=1679170 RepID=A0A0K9GSE7_9BACI|nr:hypothetical protein [Peribacillus loiseleuriae]KMY49555.1 hypothetical protein AC625_08350 [Peribacillus loiseleuriae]
MGEKVMIIDACVASSASAKDKPISTMCRKLLLEVLDSEHKLGFTKQLEEEWSNHRSLLAMKVLASMKSRKRVLFIHDSEGVFEIRDRMKDLPDKQRIEAITKDLHLIEAALLTDKIIISSDKRARNHFSSIVHIIEELKELTWINPVNIEENVIGWINSGAPQEEKRRLKSSIPT